MRNLLNISRSDILYLTEFKHFFSYGLHELNSIYVLFNLALLSSWYIAISKFRELYHSSLLSYLRKTYINNKFFFTLLISILQICKLFYSNVITSILFCIICNILSLLQFNFFIEIHLKLFLILYLVLCYSKILNLNSKRFGKSKGSSEPYEYSISILLEKRSAYM